jgi:hypothetical protein
MLRFVRTFALGIGLAALAGCAKPNQYVIVADSSESIKDKLDDHWFLRSISGDKGEIAHIELVFCPTLPDVPTVCRTSIVWEDGRPLLYELANGTPSGARLGADGRPLPDPAGPPVATPAPPPQ